MTLATILLFGVTCSMAVPPLSAQASAGQSAPQSAPASQQTETPAPNPPAETKPATAAPSKTPAKKSHSPTASKPRKKKVAQENCAPAPGAASSAKPGFAPASGTSTATGSTPTTSAPTNCPPPKTIVPQGGTSDPSIQLAGGAVGEQATQQRNTANQMLGATEQNLKKIAGQQLTVDQQGILTQIRQFIEQSKTAVAAGDTERARTLAWKAQLLSEELANPAK